MLVETFSRPGSVTVSGLSADEVALQMAAVRGLFTIFASLVIVIGGFLVWSAVKQVVSFRQRELALMRLAGSAFVIAVSEEFFWRGFLYRWMLGKNFLRVDAGRLDPMMFPAVAVLFGLEHAQWLAGIVAGLAYGWVYWRTRDIWAAAASHVVTNFLLGLYVLATGQYHFW